MANSIIVAAISTGQGFTDNNTKFTCISGRIINDGSEALNESPVRDAGTFSNLFVYAPTNTISVNSTVTLRKSRADTAITITYGADQTGIKEDTSNTATFAATDEVSYAVVTGSEAGTNTLTITVIGIQFAPTTDTNCISFLICSAHQSSINIQAASTTYYMTPDGLMNNNAVSESQVEYRARFAFTSSDFFASVNTNGRTTNTVFSTRKNSSDGGQGFTYTSGQTGVKEDTSGTDSLVAGDDFCYEIVTGTGTQALALILMSTTCTSTASKFPLLTGYEQASAVAANTTTYSPAAGALIFSTTEANSQIYPRFTFTASELGVYVSSNTGASLATTVTLRDNGGDGTLTVSYIAGQTGLKNDSVNTDAITSGGDEIDYEVTCLDLTGGVSVTWIGILGSTPQAAGAAAAVVAQKMKTRMMLGVGL